MSSAVRVEPVVPQFFFLRFLVVGLAAFFLFIPLMEQLYTIHEFPLPEDKIKAVLPTGFAEFVAAGGVRAAKDGSLAELTQWSLVYPDEPHEFYFYGTLAAALWFTVCALWFFRPFWSQPSKPQRGRALLLSAAVFFAWFAAPHLETLFPPNPYYELVRANYADLDGQLYEEVAPVRTLAEPGEHVLRKNQCVTVPLRGQGISWNLRGRGFYLQLLARSGAPKTFRIGSAVYGPEPVYLDRAMASQSGFDFSQGSTLEFCGPDLGLALLRLESGNRLIAPPVASPPSPYARALDSHSVESLYARKFRLQQAAVLDQTGQNWLELAKPEQGEAYQADRVGDYVSLWHSGAIASIAAVSLFPLAAFVLLLQLGPTFEAQARLREARRVERVRAREREQALFESQREEQQQQRVSEAQETHARTAQALEARVQARIERALHRTEERRRRRRQRIYDNPTFPFVPAGLTALGAVLVVGCLYLWPLYPAAAKAPVWLAIPTSALVVALFGAGAVLGVDELLGKKIGQRRKQQAQVALAGLEDRPAPRPVAEEPLVVPPQGEEEALMYDAITTGDLLLGDTLDEEQQQQRVVLDQEMRNRHAYVVGKTRTGKTTFLKQLFSQDMEHQQGCCFMDPHGDAAEELLGLVPEHRIGDVIYFDPTQRDAPHFNPLALPYDPTKLTEDLVSVFHMLMGDSWGPRMEHLLRFSILTLLKDEHQQHTLRDLRRLLLDESVRDETLAGVTDPDIHEFWNHDYTTMPASAAAPILNRLSALLAPGSDLQRVFSAPDNQIDFSRIMDEGRILVLNLSKGKLGEHPAFLLGALFVASIQQAALARATTPAALRRDFYLYVDEFQNFTVSSFDSILSESAKYRLNLTLANQTLGQVPAQLRQLIFGNVGTVVAFQVSDQDAGVLGREMRASSLTVRRKTEAATVPIRSFIDEQSTLFTEALVDRYSGMPRDERRDFRQKERTALREDRLREQWRASNRLDQELRERKQKVEETLHQLQQHPVNVDALKRLFPDYAFEESRFPTNDDLTNLPQHHSYCRIGQASNVIALASRMPARPDPKRRDSVLEHAPRGTVLEFPSLTHEPQTNDFTDTYDEPEELDEDETVHS